MQWCQEIGFKNFMSCIDYTFLKKDICNQEIKISDPNKSLELIIVDACCPNQLLNQKTKILITNNWIDPALVNSAQYEQFLTSWYGIYAGIVPIEEVTPTKNFNCFINRMDPIRQSWLYQLIRRGVFDQGYISFNMDISRHIAMKQCRPDASPWEVFDQQFQEQLSIFKSEHEFIKSCVPYCNFDSNIKLNQIIMDSKFSIVLETYFDRNEVITFSEKQNNTAIKITDVLGNIVSREELVVSGKEAVLNMTGYAKGIYFVQITDEKKNRVNKKIVVE